MKIHVTEEGPKKCEATIKDCPYLDGTKAGIESGLPTHFDNFEEAQAAYEKVMVKRFQKAQKLGKTDQAETKAATVAKDLATFKAEQDKQYADKVKKFITDNKHLLTEATKKEQEKIVKMKSVLSEFSKIGDEKKKWNNISSIEDWNEEMSNDLQASVETEAIYDENNRIEDYEVVDADVDGIVAHVVGADREKWPKSLADYVDSQKASWLNDDINAWGLEIDEEDGELYTEYTTVPSNIFEGVQDWYYDNDPKLKSWEAEEVEKHAAYLHEQSGSSTSYDDLIGSDYRKLVAQAQSHADVYRINRFSEGYDSITLRMRLRDSLVKNKVIDSDVEWNDPSVVKEIENYANYAENVKFKPQMA